MILESALAIAVILVLVGAACIYSLDAENRRLRHRLSRLIDDFQAGTANFNDVSTTLKQQTEWIENRMELNRRADGYINEAIILLMRSRGALEAASVKTEETF